MSTQENAIGRNLSPFVGFAAVYSKFKANFMSTITFNDVSLNSQYENRKLPPCDIGSQAAESMTEAQRQLYFNCIDLAALGGFEYRGGIGGGSMSFYRTQTIVSEFSIRVGNTEEVDLSVSPIRTTRDPNLIVEHMSEFGNFAKKLALENVSFALGIPFHQDFDRLEKECFSAFRMESNKRLRYFDHVHCEIVFKTNFDHLRTHIAMAIDLSDICEKFAISLDRK